MEGEAGEPKEYLEIERLNDKLDSFEYSFRKASISRASALRVRGFDFDRGKFS